MEIKKSVIYKVFFNGKVVNNYAYKEPSNPSKFCLVEDANDVNTWMGSEIKNFGWDKIPNMKFVKVGVLR